MTKKISLVALAIALAIVAAPALAQDTTDEVNVGITPDSPVYFLDDFWKSVRLTFTLNDEKKEDLRLKFSEERLAEAQLMIEEKKEAASAKALERYEGLIQKLEEKAATEEDEDKQARIAERIANATEKHFEVLERIEEKAPDSAKAAIRRAITTSENGHVEALRALSEKKGELAAEFTARALDKRAELIEKFKDRADDAEHEAERFERFVEFAEELKSRVETRTDGTRERIRVRLDNATSQNQETLRRVLGQVPDAAKDTIQRVLDKFENVDNPRSLKDILLEVEQKRDERKDELRIRTEEKRDQVLDRVRDRDDDDENGDKVCIQVITPAKDPNTGRVVNFRNPCVVPDGWEIIRSTAGSNSSSSVNSVTNKAIEVRTLQKSLFPQVLQKADPTASGSSGSNDSTLSTDVFEPIKDLLE